MVTSEKNKTQTVLYIQGTSRMGGAPESLHQLVRSLPRDRYEPIVVCSENNRLTEKLGNEEIAFETIRMGMWRKGKNFPSIPITLYRLSKLAKSCNASLIHANSLWDAPYAGLTAKFVKIPCVVHIRTEHPEDRAKKYLLKHADSIITISDSLKKPFEGNPDIFSKITTIYNGLDMNPFEFKRNHVEKKPVPSKKQFIIGYIGRIDQQKGIGDLIASFSLLGELNENAKIVIVGDTTGKSYEYYKRLKTTIDVLKLSHRVEFTGYKEDILDLIFSFDLLVLPSLKEGFGRVLIEAMAAGVPVIGTSVGGIPEIIDDGVNGFIVPPSDPENLKESIKRIMEESSLREKFSIEGIKKVKDKFTIEENVQKVLAIYEDLLKR